MKKNSRKILGMMLAAALMLGCLAGCGEKKPEPDSVSWPLPALTAEEMYEGFLNDGIPAIFGYAAEGFESGRGYTISEISKIFMQGMSDDWGAEVFLDRVFYSDIDCGLDGAPELAVQIGYQIPRGEYNEYYTQYYVLKAFDQELRVLTEDYDYYRSFCNINSAGVIFTGGSSSAVSWVNSPSFIDAEGNRVFLYTQEYVSGMSEAVVPFYMVPVSMQKEGYGEEGMDFDENGLNLIAYNFTDYRLLDLSKDEDNDKYARGYYFCFTDNDDKDVPPAERYAALYEEKGVRIVTREFMEQFLATYMDEMGVPEGALNTEPADWTELIDADWMPKG